MKRFLSLFVGLACVGVLLYGANYVRTRNLYIPYTHIDAADVAKTVQDSDAHHFDMKIANKEMGIDFVYRTPEFDPAIAHRVDTYFVGTGSAVGDVNGDGYMDIFIPAGHAGDKNKLYINQHGERFVDKAEEWGVADNPPETATTTPVFFDANNSGRPDLFLTGAGCSRFYRNTGHKFEEVKDSGLIDCRNSMNAVVLDYDNDGLPDVYVLRYWPEVNLFHLPHYNVYVSNLTDATNGGNNTLYRNLGNGKFADVTKQTHSGDTHWSYDATYGDFRNTGKLEMYIAEDYGPDTFFEIGDVWKDKSSETIKPDRRYGMNATIMDQGSINPMIYISNGYLGPPFDITGNFLWQFTNKEVRGHEMSMQKNLFNCGFAWGGLAADFNLDGKQDLYVSNGFISNGPPPSAGGNSYKRRAEFTELSARSLPGVVSSDIRHWPNLTKTNSFGYQRDCLFLNLGKEGFVDNAWKYHIDDALRDSRSAAGIDIRNDGAISVLSKPSKGPVTLYMNMVKAPKNWIGFSMVGTVSNRMGAGGRIEVVQNGKSQWRWNTAGHSGNFTNSDPRLHFGLETTDKVDAIVRWPSGRVQTLSKLEPGRYYEVKEK